MRFKGDTNMRIAICDDEERDLLEIKEAIRSLDLFRDIEICAFTSASALYNAAKIKNYDIAILDIEMDPPNGYEIATKLVNLDPAPIIIFLTNSMAYTLRGYGVAFRYLTKPIDQSKLESALSAAAKEAASRRFVFTVEGSSHVLRMDDIFYFEVFNHLIILHTMDQAFQFRATLKDILPQLPVGYFGSPHQSYIVNFNHVKTAMSNEIHLTNGEVVPISRRKQRDFENQFCMYLRR